MLAIGLPRLGFCSGLRCREGRDRLTLLVTVDGPGASVLGHWRVWREDTLLPVWECCHCSFFLPPWGLWWGWGVLGTGRRTSWLCGPSQPQPGPSFQGLFPAALHLGHLWLGVSPAEPGPWSQGQAPLSLSLGTSLGSAAPPLFPLRPHPHSPDHTSLPMFESLCLHY